MESKLDRKSKSLCSLLLAFALLLGLGGLNMGQLQAVTTVTNHKGSIVLHKLQYTNDTNPAPSVRNNGRPLGSNDLNGAVPYDKSKYGDVGFTLYKLNAQGQAYAENQVGGLSDIQNIAHHLAENADTMLEVVVAEKLVDAQGKVTFDDIDADETFYVIKETRSSDSTVVSKAAPMFVQLPVTYTNPDTQQQELLYDVHLYPKNKVQEKTFEIIKKKAMLNEDALKHLDGAKFQLYKGVPGDTGADTPVAVGTPITTADGGKIDLKGLSVGKFFLVELDSDVVDGNTEVETEPLQAKRLIVDTRFLNNADNKLRFTVNADTTITIAPDQLIKNVGDVDNPVYNIVNYEKPSFDKKIKNPKNPGKPSVDISETMEFNINIGIPHDVAEYTVFSYTDVPTIEVRGGSVVPDSDALKIDKDSIVLKIDNTPLIKDTDYTVSNSGNNGYMIDFIVNNGHVSATVAAGKGKTIAVSYNATLNANVVPEATVKNKAELSYTNGNNGKPRSGKGEVEVRTYGRKFVKKDAGIFNTGVVTANIQGAEFIVYREKPNGFSMLREYLVIDAQNEHSWVQDKTTAKHFVSGVNGEFEVTGLAEGYYYLEEVKAPAGYNMLQDSVRFDVGDGSYSDPSQVLEVHNSKSPDMPMTGSEQVVLIIAGLIVVLGAALLIGRKVKKSSK